MTTRRTVLQHLESLARAGVTHLPICRAPLAIAEPPKPVKTAAKARETPPAAITAPSEPPTPSLPPGPFDNLPADRVQALAIVNENVQACTKCEELAKLRKQTVFGVGNPHARIVFVGEAPGADEDEKGEPFVGRAGQLLNDIIRACKLTREEIYICNILKCRPPGNRTPSGTECVNCRPFLLAQLRIIDPEYIVCWGTVAAQNVVGSQLPIGKLRGKFYRFGNAKVLCTYHPSYLLRNPSAKKDVWADMKFLFKDMGIDLVAKS